MPVVRDSNGNPLNEKDWIVMPPHEPLLNGRISNIAPIMEKGPFTGGTLVEIDIKVSVRLPAGHIQIPVFKTDRPGEDKKSLLEP